MDKRLTECHSLAVKVDEDTQKGSEARGEQQIEARDPATDDGTLLKTLLSELPADRSNVNQLYS